MDPKQIQLCLAFLMTALGFYVLGRLNGLTEAAHILLEARAKIEMESFHAAHP